MRPRIPLSIGAICILVAGLAAPLTAQPTRDRGPCEQITAACQAAGFTQGGARAGAGLQADCIVPIMQSAPQPRRASKPLPQVDPQLVTACRSSNPRFGQGSVPPTTAAARPLPVTNDSLPSGLVVVLPPGKQRDHSSDLQALNNPFMSGVALQIDWRDIEPDQGKPDWSRLDELFASAESSKKWVQLLIFPGFFSPAWALDGAETDLFPIQYGPGRGTVAKLPMPWDRAYLDRWFAFLKQLSDRYGRSPAFKLMAAAGPTSVSAEMTLPIKRPDVTKWLAHGYTSRKYLDAWERVLQAYAEDFPNQCVSLSAPGLPLLDQGRVVDAPAHSRARQAIIDQGIRVLGRRFAIQWSDLHAGRAAVEAPDQTTTVIGYSGRIITGLQMRTSAEGSSGVMGAEGNPPLALRRSIDKGMELNSAGQHVNYLEVYRPDVLADEMQPVLQYAASLFARK
jgi:hypothetical protein